jgi:hypothetical protein
LRVVFRSRRRPAETATVSICSEQTVRGDKGVARWFAR